MKRFIVIIIFLILMNTTFAVTAEMFPSGNGTESTPYTITNLANLRFLSENSSYWGGKNYFVQTANIDASSTSELNDGTGFLPIGNFDNNFTGSYDGQGYTISNLYINSSSQVCVGLFGVASNSVITDVGLTSIVIIGNGGGYSGGYVGGLVGAIWDDSVITGSYTTGVVSTNNSNTEIGGLAGLVGWTSSINSSYSTANVSGGYYSGGLVGWLNEDSMISNSYATGNISDGHGVGGLVGCSEENSVISDSYATGNVSIRTSWTYNYSGGLVGEMNSSSIISSFTSGEVVNGSARRVYTGGLVGQSIYGSVLSSFALGNVTSEENREWGKTGGFIGRTYSTIISNCYARNCVEGDGEGYVAGFIASVSYNTDITNCYSASIVGGTCNNLGGFISNLESENTNVNNSYWDTETSGQATSAGGEGRTTVQMTYPYNAETYVDWDFISAWSEDTEYFNGGYPHLLQSPILSVPIEANFTSDITQGITPLTVNFSDLTSGSPAMWAWDFDNDGIIDSDEQHPSWIYEDAGVHSVKLVVSNGVLADSLTIDSLITTVDPLAVEFSTDVTTGIIPLTVNITNLTTGTLGTWAWDFDNDGVIDSYEQNPSWTYEVAGVYSVKLIVENSLTSDSLLVENLITANEPLEPNFAADITLGYLPLTVNFSDLTIGIPETWAWDFNNDGEIDSYEQNPIWTYQEIGKYTVTLTVSNQNRTNTYTKSVVSYRNRETDSITKDDFIEVILAPLNGQGIEEDPFQICTFEDLQWISQNSASWGRHFIQTADIDATGNGWSPIGNLYSSFTGTYNGQGHTIDGIYVNRENHRYAGLFARISGATIMNLGIINVDIYGRDYCGGLAGRSSNSQILNSYTTGVVKGNYTSDSSMGNFVGALVGHNENNSTISNCYSNANSYGRSVIGGLVGSNDESSSISNCYSTGAVSGLGSVGGLVATNDGTVYGSYWNIQTSGQLISGGGHGRSVAQMTYPFDSETFVDWNFSSAWSNDANNEHCGLPYLQGFEVPVMIEFYADEVNVPMPQEVNFMLLTNVVFDSWEWDFNDDGEIDSIEQNPSWIFEEIGKQTITLNLLNQNRSSFITMNSNNMRNRNTFTLTKGDVIDVSLGIGQGNEEYPYQISTFSQLCVLPEDPSFWDCHFIQTADIDASASVHLYDGAGWKPIGVTEASSFRGSYDGQGYTIDGLYINRGSEIDVGFFGYVTNATITNFGIINVDIIGNTGIGALIGTCINSIISNCYSSGFVRPTHSITGYIGGLVGGSYHSTVDKCHSEATVGSNTLEIYGIGGLVGKNRWDSTISNSYSTGSVSGDGLIGGLVGENFTGSHIENCYSTGYVNGNSSVGGLVGENVGNVNNSFWNIETSGQSSSAGGTGITTSGMQTLSTYLVSGWDFVGETSNGSEDTWTFIANDYPHLVWEGFEQQLSIPPTNLQAVFENDMVNLTWDPVNTLDRNSRDLIGYNIYRNDIQVNDGLILNTNYSDSEITLGLEYDYYVTAVYHEEESQASNNIRVNVGNYVIPFTGEGTSFNPYLINTLDDLIVLSQQSYIWNKHFLQTADIDASSTIELNNGAGFSPIGNNSQSFHGSYDGKGHTISNLYINRPASDYIGLFGKTDYSDTSIKNLATVNVEISGNSFVGALVGSGDSGTISNCYTTGSVNGANLVGGLVGKGDFLTVNNSYAKVAVSGTGDVGGLIGYLGYYSINNSFWDIEFSGVTTSDGGIGKTTEQMQDINTFLDAGWDFDDVWFINPALNSGYPVFIREIITNISLPNKSTQVSLTPTISFELNPLISNYEVYFGSTLDPTTCLIPFSIVENPISYTFINSLENLTDYYWKVIGYTENNESIDLNFTFTTVHGLEGLGTPNSPYLINNITDLIQVSLDSSLWDKHFLQTADIDASITHPDNGNVAYKPIGNQEQNFTGYYDGNYHIVHNLCIGNGSYSGSHRGLFGYVNSATISNLGVVDFNITGWFCIGGIAGALSNSTVSNCYTSGDANGYMNVGNFIGYISGNTTISNCYATGTAYGIIDSYVFGFFDFNSNLEIINCYSSASGGYGLATQQNDTSIVNSFWDNEVAYQANFNLDNSLTTDEMQTLSTYLNAGWDFVGESDNGTEDIWTFLANDYPHLAWEGYQQQLSIPPTNLQAVFENEMINLTWEHVSVGLRDNRALIGFNIYRDGIQINDEVVLNAQYSGNDVPLGFEYDYYVTALYDEEESQASNSVMVFAIGNSSELPVPENIIIEVNNNNVELSWDAVNYDVDNNPVSEVLYIVYCTDNNPYNNGEYYYLTSTTTLSWIHENVDNISNQLFYQIKCYENVNDDILSMIINLRDHKQKRTQKQIESLIHDLKKNLFLY